MRVLHVIDSFRPGGAQELIATIIRYAGTDFSHECASFVGPGPVGEELRAQGIPVAYLANRKWQLARAALDLRRIIRRTSPDVVNLHLECSTLVGLLFRSRNAPPKYVVTVHALREQLPRMFYPLFKHLANRAEGIIVEDRVSRRQVASTGYPDDRIHLVPIGTDYHDRATDRQDQGPGIREEFGIPDAAPLLLNVARLHPIKGQAHLLRAFASIRRRVPDCRLIIVGWGPDEKPLTELATRLRLKQSVVFAGPRRDLARFYAEANVFAMTSLEENMGVVIYQAMAMGLPVVSFDAGSIAEIIDDRRTGLLVKAGDVDALADQLATVLEEPASFRRTIGTAARRRIESEYSAETMTRRYETVYRSLIST